MRFVAAEAGFLPPGPFCFADIAASFCETDLRERKKEIKEMEARRQLKRVTTNTEHEVEEKLRYSEPYSTSSVTQESVLAVRSWPKPTAASNSFGKHASPGL